MSGRIELDFTHGLAEPRVEFAPRGVRLTLSHGETSLTVVLSRASFEALWLAIIRFLKEA
jgi:hypothetical protein